MVPLPVVMDHEFPDGMSKRALSEKHHSTQALLLEGFHEPLRIRIEVRCPYRKADDLNTFTRQRAAKLFGVLRVSIQDQVALAAQEAVSDIRQVASHLHHPALIWMHRRSGNVYGTRGQVDEKQNVVCDQASPRADFHAEKVCRYQTLPMRLQESRPPSPLASFRSRIQAPVLQDPGDGATTDCVAEIAERALEASVTLGGILQRHTYDQLDEGMLSAGSSRGASVAEISFASDEFTIPTQQRVRRDERFQLIECVPTERVRLAG